MTINEEYTKKGYDLLNTHKELEAISTYGVQIAFLSSNKAKKSNGKVVFADCTKVSDRYKWTCPFDYMITVYEPNVAEYKFTEEQMDILLWHEMLHIGIDESSKNGPKLYVKPHDIEDFRMIIEAAGLDWHRGEMYGQEGKTDKKPADRKD